jgi:DNA polymerase-3 subunit gamma/tau
MSLSKDDYRVKYRPLRYDQLWQGLDDPTISALIEQEKAVKYPKGVIYAGDYGCGKTSAARIRGMRSSCWNWDKDPVEPCGQCLGCQAAMTVGKGPDYYELDATQEKLRSIVDDAMARSATLKRNSHPYMPRVFFVDEAHRAHEKVQNMLLHEMKQHQEHIFILSTADPSKLLPTVRDYCQMFHFKQPPVPVVVAKLEEVARKEGVTLQPGVAQAIAERKKCVPRDCLGTLYECTFVSLDISLDDLEMVLGDQE